MPSAASVEPSFGNPFLKKLLSLQQDGSGAISSPSNWLKEPLLRVETPTIRRVAAFVEMVAAAVTPQWLVLVGGPGNGKSMAVQELAKQLLARGLTISDEAGVPIDQMESRPIPAVLEVRSANGDLVARIAQDASVVPNPYVAEPNPAADLQRLLSKCIHDGCHLIACANRGVLEASAALVDTNDKTGLDEVMKVLVATGRGEVETKAVLLAGSGITLTACAMDVGSLFEGDAPIFDQLLDLATASVHWESCVGCPVATRCPFRINRNELANVEVRRKVARLVEDAELLDGQPLVFREAGALVSLFLAGCAADYGNETPCQWVLKEDSAEAWFRLASRRLHMLLFSASAPLGIHRADDLQALRSLCEQVGVSHERLLQGAPSTRVGLPRLLGPNGVMRKLDPLSGPLERALESWDDGFVGNENSVTELEHACQAAWDELDLALQDPQPNAAAGLAALSRWRSSHSIRFAALHTGLYTWRAEIKRFKDAIGIPNRPSLNERNRLEGMLREVLESDDGIRVAPHVRVDAAACGEVRIDWTASYARRSICIGLGDATGVLAQIPAAAFVWLSRRRESPLHDGSFPRMWLQSARDAIARAASACQYSRERSGRIFIEDGRGRILELAWAPGEVEVQESNDA